MKPFELILSYLFLSPTVLLFSVARRLFEGCNTVYKLPVTMSFLESPFFPDFYPQNSSCRYIFLAPIDHEIFINCTIQSPEDQARKCSSDIFYISTDGKELLKKSEQFCGSRQIVRKSLFHTMIFAYNSESGEGRFQCQLDVVPLKECDCGWSVQSKITNGEEITPNEYPSLVGLRDIYDDIDLDAFLFCGGAIVSHRYIITAAHCMMLHPVAQSIIAFVGVHDTSSVSHTPYEAYYQIESFVLHPRYSSDPIYNDIALLRTIENIEWLRGVGPICLPSLKNKDNDFVHTFVDLVGWGSQEFDGDDTEKPHKVTVMVAENSACSFKYKDMTRIYDSHICTYDQTSQFRDTCHYDAGGPVIYRESRQFILGVISYGKMCGVDAAPMSVNTRITSYLDWIKEVTDDGACFKDILNNTAV